MIDVVFVAGLATVLFGALAWGTRTLPSERWQMIAAVPMAKNGNGGWQGLNLTFYGFFSATASTFGVAMAIVLLSSVGTPLLAAAAVITTMMAICVPASRLMARLIEGKRNTFTVAGAAFLATLILPPGLLLAQRVLASWFGIRIYVMPTIAATAITYALSEAIGRMACLSFGCCYGKPLREVSPRMAWLFARFPLVFHGDTKKAAYASGLAEEPLIPVQTITSVVFTISGLVGLGFFLAGHWRLAGIVPALGDLGLAGGVGIAARRSSRPFAHLDISGDGPGSHGVPGVDADDSAKPGASARLGCGPRTSDVGGCHCDTASAVGGAVSLLRAQPRDWIGCVVSCSRGEGVRR